MKMPNPETIDTWLGIVQKLAIVVGIIISAWFFLWKEEGSPHVKLVMDPKFMPGCILRINVKVENAGGRVWQLSKAIARVFPPNTELEQTHKDESNEAVGTQIIKSGEMLRVGETASFGFNIRPKVSLNVGAKPAFLVVKAFITIKEEGPGSLWIVEESVKLDGC